MRQLLLGAVTVGAIIGAACAPRAVAGEAPSRLSEPHRRLVDAVVSEVEKRCARWELLARDRPRDVIFSELAREGREAVSGLRALPLRSDDLGRWASSMFAGGAPVAAYSDGAMYLDNGLFSMAEAASLTPAEERERATRLASLGSYLLHELVHSRQGVGTKLTLDRGEAEAYRKQYRFLRACGVPDDDSTMKSVKQQLVRRGLLKEEGDTAALDRAEGLEPVLARGNEGPTTGSSPAGSGPASRAATPRPRGVERGNHPGGQRAYEKHYYEEKGRKVLDGPSTAWHESGQVAEKGAFADDRRTGTWRAFRPDGSKVFVDEYREGACVEHRWWYPDGRPGQAEWGR